MKNLLDKIFSAFLLILTSPLVIIAGIFIFLEDGFPIFFRQKRVGWDGKSFIMFKLRSLLKKDKTPEIKQVLKGDKRLLKVGAIIRRFSIDELPQFYNVLKGDMSIVGPRPHPVTSVALSNTEIFNFMQRHKCPPGLTGWAQTHGFRGRTQSKESMERRFRYDLYYIKNWNLMLDFYIIVKTVFVVLFQKED